MKNLLKFEWRKLWQSKSLYIVFGVGLLCMVLSMVAFKMLSMTVSATASTLLALQSSNFISLVGASLLSVFVTIFACADHSQHTIKNIYARGYNRTAVYFSKYLISLLVTFMIAAIYMALNFVLALILGGEVGSMPAGFDWGDLALQFWVLFGLHSLYFGVSMIIGKMAGSLAVNLVGIGLFFVVLNAIITIAKIDFDITEYELDYILMGLSGPLGIGFAQKPDLLHALLVPAVYAVVFITAGWLVNRRRDV